MSITCRFYSQTFECSTYGSCHVSLFKLIVLYVLIFSVVLCTTKALLRSSLNSNKLIPTCPVFQLFPKLSSPPPVCNAHPPIMNNSCLCWWMVNQQALSGQWQHNWTVLKENHLILVFIISTGHVLLPAETSTSLCIPSRHCSPGWSHKWAKKTKIYSTIEVRCTVCVYHINLQHVFTL